MSGKIAVVTTLLSTLIAWAAMYCLQVYGYYRTVAPIPGQDVQLVSLVSEQPEPNGKGVDYKNGVMLSCIDYQESPASLIHSYSMRISSMNKFMYYVLLPLFALTVPVHADESTDDPELLFVQGAAGITVDGDTLTLKGVNPTVVFFSDRPQRIAGHVRLSGFLQLWDEGKDSFAADPPNANLSVLGDNVVSSTLVELSNPRLSSDDLIYDVKVLDGSWPSHNGEVALFIDGLFTGGALKSGVRGGAIGAIGGAIGGDTGKGAAIGAGIGVVGGLIHDSKE